MPCSSSGGAGGVSWPAPLRGSRMYWVWLRGLELSAARAPPKADGEGWVDQPRGRRAQRQARGAARAASAKSQTSAASGAPSSGGGATAIERLQVEVEQLEELLAAPPDGVDGCFTDVVASQLEAKRSQQAQAEREAAEQKASAPPRSAQLHKEANAISKSEKRMRAARKTLEEKRAARELAEAQLQKAQEELATLEGEALEDAARDDEEAQRRQRASQMATSSQIPGLLTQLEKLPEAWRSNNFEVAWAAICARMAAVRSQLVGPPERPRRERWAESCPMDEDLISSGDEGDDKPGASGSVWGPRPADASWLARLLTWLLLWPLLGLAALAAEAAGPRQGSRECRPAADAARTGGGRARLPAVPGEAAAATQQARGGLEVLGINGNTWRRGMDVLEAFVNREGSRPHLVMLQETRLAPHQLQSACGRAKGLVHAAFLHASAATDREGPLPHSGGVGILVRDDLQGGKVDWQAPGDLRHRIIGVTVAAASGLELLACSLYLQDSLGPKGANLDIFAALGDMVLTTGLPWLVQGDFNIGPGALHEFGWPNVQRGACLGPSETARRAQRAEHVYDWFASSYCLAHGVAETAALDGYALFPHKPVRLLLQDVRPDALVQVLVRPGRFPDVDADDCCAREGALVQVRRRVGRARWKALPCSWRVLEPLSAAVKREHRHRHSALTHGIRQALDLALQRLRAERAQRWHPSHECWYVHKAERAAHLLEETTAAACQGDEVVTPSFGTSEWSDLVRQAGVHGHGGAIQVLQLRLAAPQRRDGAWRARVKEAVQRGGRLAHGFARAVSPPKVVDPAAGRPLAGVLAVDQLEANWQKLRSTAGLGADQLHPRQLVLLPVALQLRCLDILAAYEERPQALGAFVTMMVFIAKADALWEAEHDCRFFWGKADRGCEKAGWLHNQCAAFARESGFDSASLFLDITKFYENLRHDVLWSCATGHGFNLRLLRGLLVMYQSPRFISFVGLASDVFCTQGAVLAGCACATTVAKLPVLGALPAASASGRPRAVARDVVDGIALQSVGTERLVAAQLGSAVARNLGTDASITRRSVHEGRARAAGALQRARRLRCLKAAGVEVDLIHVTGPTASMIRGRAATGIADGELHSWRPTARRSAGRLPCGAALGLRLRRVELRRRRDLGPAVLAAGCTVQMLAALLQSGELPLRMLGRGLEAAAARRAEAASPWVHCASPVDAAVFTWTGTEWHFESERCLVTGLEDKLDLALLGPRGLGIEAGLGARRASDRHEMRKLAREREQRALIAYISNAHWTQARLYDAKWRGRARCRCCGEARGTLWHRLFECPMLAAQRRCDDDGNLVVGVYGTVGRDLCPQQTAKDGEDFAVWMQLHRLLSPAGPSLRRGAQQGQRPPLEQDPRGIRAWLLCSAEGARALQPQAVLGGRLAEAQRRGDDRADRLAKMGATLHALDSQAVGEHHALAEVVRELARWIGRAAVILQGVSEKDSEGLPDAGERRQARFEAPPDSQAPPADQEEEGPEPKRPRLESARSAGSAAALSASAAASSILGHARSYACCGDGEQTQELAARAKCGAYTVRGGRSGAKPRLKEPCLADETDKSGRDQRRLWERGRRPAGRPRSAKQRQKDLAIPSLRGQGPVPADAHERHLEWLGVVAEQQAAGAPVLRAPAEPQDLLAACGLSEAELAASAQAAVSAVERRRVRRRTDRIGQADRV
ncbi:unnamed protein product [Prorocentrum cordatum]|uniref:Endonuclease/exonuclease/phosphatase domain-containing protein n=1 Tax=Prorocentrum cordatum TaxID=2364126 RepID=A0ABN9VNX3_9DINO|nr:unnamed protein product [Polarella glacialis]